MIQKYLIQYILSPLGAIMDKLSEKTKNFLFVLAGLCVVLQLFMRNMSMAKYRFLIFYAVDCVFLGVMILCTVSKDMKPVKFRWPLAVCWFGVGFLMLLSGIINNVDYLPEALLFLVVYPVLFLCWNNCDRTRIFRLLLRICKISLIIFAAASFLFTNIQSERYPGIFNNTNGAAYYLAVCVICQLVELIYEKRFGIKTVIDILLLGLAVALLYYTNSRTGPLGAIIAVIGGVGMYVITHGWKDNLRCIIRMGVAGIVAVIFALNLVYVFQLRQKMDFPVYFDPYSGQFYVVQKAPEVDETVLPEAAPEEFFDTSGFNTVTDQKSSMENKTLDQYSTGRISIWKAYAKDLNWTGHAVTPKVYIDWLYKEISTTHMTILQVAYESGIPAGIFYFLLNMGTGFVSIWFVWKNRKEQYAAMPLMVTLVFGVMSMLGSCGVSLWYMTTLYYYLVQFPIIAYRPENEADKPAELGMADDVEHENA
ncbi:MAG: O-antigen ligase family protein [Oscillospiraceae bacterium]|nr:O-antigen ligase family protein [Oscillospiraceae bacterium]